MFLNILQITKPLNSRTSVKEFLEQYDIIIIDDLLLKDINLDTKYEIYNFISNTSFMIKSSMKYIFSLIFFSYDPKPHTQKNCILFSNNELNISEYKRIYDCYYRGPNLQMITSKKDSYIAYLFKIT